MLAAVNRQKEISVHNIYGIEALIYDVLPFVLLAYALFSRSIARLLGKSARGSQLSPSLLAVAPMPWYSVGYFLPMAIFCANAWLLEHDVFQDQEPSELFVSLGFLLAALHARNLTRADRLLPSRY
jgi:hypothetical protein